MLWVSNDEQLEKGGCHKLPPHSGIARLDLTVTISLDPKVQYLYLESTLGKINSVRIANVNEARQSGAPKWAKQRWS